MSETEVQPASSIPASPAQVAPAAQLFIGLSSPADPAQLQELAAAVAADAGLGARVTIAYPGAEQTRTSAQAGVELLSYPLPNVDTGTPSPWAQRAAAQVALLVLAVEEQATATVLLHGVEAAPKLDALAGPVLGRRADLVMAEYTQAPYDGLLNAAILAPLSRALYGRRVRFPLAPDLALSPRLAARLSVTAHGRGMSTAPILWPVTTAAGIDAVVTEAALGQPLATLTTDMDLREVLTQLVGSAFAEMESHAPLWQRTRTAPGTPVSVNIASAVTPASARIETTEMIQSFLLASRNLQDVWNLVLPPVTLLDLKRITAMPAERFTLPDELWVRIVYDFALAYRLRTLNRVHLLGALTPLYLGWVASYVRQTAPDNTAEAASRFEKLARAFEEGKPYLVRRWRWPDRFNP